MTFAVRELATEYLHHFCVGRYFFEVKLLGFASV